MTWQKLTLYLSRDLIEKASEFLEEFGALAITLQAENDEEVFEPALGTTPLWQHTQMIALFEADTDIKTIFNALQQALQPAQIAYHAIETVYDQDWQKICNDNFKPQCFADNLWIYPSWHELPDKDKPHVLLDPGLAFGTGSHPTTALCLDWLARHIEHGDQVIDYGCGSGILAIAALKLGAKQVWAVDNDPQALEATLENGLRNECSMAALEIALPEQLPAITCDILIANILANPLIALAPTFSTLVKRGGHIVLSGILPEQANAVIDAYKNWVEFSPLTEQEGWVRLEGKKLY